MPSDCDLRDVAHLPVGGKCAGNLDRHSGGEWSQVRRAHPGRDVAIPFGEHPETCPVRALREYLKGTAITRDAVFRSISRHGRLSASGLHRDSIGTILKRAATKADVDATNLAGHSMRAGMAAQAAMSGAGERSITKTTGHKSRRILRRYIRSGQLFRENASANLGL